MTRTIIRTEARRDILAAHTYYRANGGATVARDFAQAVELAVSQILRHPGKGSPFWQQRLAMPGLRKWKIAKFPYLAFYLDLPSGPEVIRVFHMSQNIPAALRD